MRKVFVGLALVASVTSAYASASATVTCGPSQQQGSVVGWGAVPTINVSYATGQDAGQPGVFWLGILTPDQQVADALDTGQRWIQYTGGLYPPNQVFVNGLPGVVTVSIPFPSNPDGSTATDTSQFVGYTIYAGHGVLTAQAKQQVAYRRQYLTANKARMQQDGTWSSAYETDTQFEWALVQKDMTDNKKWGAVLTVPYVSCGSGSN